MRGEGRGAEREREREGKVEGETEKKGMTEVQFRNADWEGGRERQNFYCEEETS